MNKGIFYAGKSGAGHYLKMVHNGIGVRHDAKPAGEGFNLLEAAEYDFCVGESSRWCGITARLLKLA